MDTQTNVIIAILVVVVGTSIWVYFDAQSIGMRKGKLKGVCDMDPGGWFAACLGLWIITFPAYLSKRSALLKGNTKQPEPLEISFDEQLRKLAKLKQEGLLSEEEFNVKKKALLGL